MSTGDWPEVVIAATNDTAERYEQWLFAAGAVSVTYQDKNDQPILEPAPGEMRLWDDIQLVGLFAQGENTESIHAALLLSAAAMGLAAPTFELRILQDAVWERAWMQDYQSMQFGPKLWVCPSHCANPDQDAVIVHLDPGLAFGTGTHETTDQCLQWLGRNTQQSSTPLSGLNVLDYGCGSGVLAIAAALLGAPSVIAVDIDQQALDATQQNASDNGVLQQLQIGYPDDAELLPQSAQFDLILANILFEPLTHLAERFAGLVRPGGQLVMAGMLSEQVAPLSMSYNKWFEIAPETDKNGWALMTATRRPN
jgi:ribosomal protein L11 methyltransferase